MLAPVDRLAAQLDLTWRLLDRKDRNEAAQQALRAHDLARELGDHAAALTAQSLLASLLPGYHLRIAHEPMRAAAWDAALRSVVTPGMRALEIGTGSGILAMLAARAGAAVASCESSRALAALAREIIARNGFSDAIRVVAKPIGQLRVPEDMAQPAELLFYDTFADNLFGFKPFRLAREALPLLAPGARVMPQTASLRGALAEFVGWNRRPPERVAGLDLGPTAVLNQVSVDVNSANPRLQLRSGAVTLVEARLPDDMPADQGSVTVDLESEGGIVSGMAVWLRLELAPGHVLDAQPRSHPLGFYARPTFHAFDRAFETRHGDRFTVRLAWRGARIMLTRIDKGERLDASRACP